MGGGGSLGHLYNHIAKLERTGYTSNSYSFQYRLVLTANFDSTQSTQFISATCFKNNPLQASCRIQQVGSNTVLSVAGVALAFQDISIIVTLFDTTKTTYFTDGLLKLTIDYSQSVNDTVTMLF